MLYKENTMKNNNLLKAEISAVFKEDRSFAGQTWVGWYLCALVHVDFPFSVKWEILDVEMEGGRLAWRSMGVMYDLK